MNLTDFQKKIAWGLGILFILILWITFPLIFKEWIFTLLVKPPFTPEAYASLGPIGDIFGGLTAFFTSATLIIVMYSAYLQKKANIDARADMQVQLDQATSASEAQLKQAKNSSKNQLRMARLTHEAQIKEIKKTNIDTRFYNLLNYKKDLLNAIRFTNSSNIQSSGCEVFDSLCTFFIRETKDISGKVDLENLKNLFNLEILNLNNGKGTLSIYSYFKIYESIFLLLDKEDLKEEERSFYYHVLRCTMQTSEQMLLFYMAPLFPEYMKLFKNKRLIDSFRLDKCKKYVDQFYDDSYFYTEN
ncbi:putative phage abortive infection protein [Acinetobacter baumannii]